MVGYFAYFFFTLLFSWYFCLLLELDMYLIGMPTYFLSLLVFQVRLYTLSIHSVFLS